MKVQHSEEDDPIIQESSPPRKAAKEDLDERIIEEEGHESKEPNTKKSVAVKSEKMDQDKPHHEGTIIKLEEEIDVKDRRIDKWINFSTNRTKCLKYEMSKMSKENNNFKQELTRKDNIIEHFHGKLQVLQNKINEHKCPDQPHEKS